ncbi:MAG TPA: radical SAM protein [Steroidobacteraceae bacterium]|nr:radical SAM protein [Steroidobacteraceae bacterium]
MLSILVCHSYFLRFDQKQVQRAKPYPPLATLQVAALLRGAGHEVSFFDSMLAENLERFERQLDVMRPQLVVFYEDNFNFLSKMCLGRMREACCRMIGLVRARGARLIAAGSDASDAPAHYLGAGADAVLHGEALGELVAIVDRLNGDISLGAHALAAGLPHVSIAGAAGPERSRAVARLPEPVAAPLPAWDLVDVEKYRRVWTKAHGHFSLNMAASRGCSFRCNWCAKPIWGNQYIQRSPRETAAEMIHLRRHYRPDHIWFADDIFGFKADWVDEFAAALAENGGGIPFTIQLRADLVGARMTESLRAAGCREIWLGAESGSQRILDAMNKGTRVGEILKARRLLGAAGMRVGFFLQLGYLGEDIDDILATRALVREARPDDVGVSVSYPLPGTKFYEMVKEQLGAKRHWQESNDLEMMFAGTYRSDFYRLLRNLLHDEVTQAGDPALQQRWNDLVEREEEYRQDGALPSPGALSIANA